MRTLPIICLLTLIGASPPATQESSHGPDVVILRELMKMYEPVPFDHNSHAQMAEMWEGCTTCHHRPPTSQPAEAEVAGANPHDQNDAAKIPACKSCHAVDAVSDDIQMPNLKGAYHRQCLNCHREWASANSCNVCHPPLENAAVAAQTNTPGDIVGRMHPPIPEPTVKVYKARFTPVDGPNVTFRHDEHVKTHKLKCVNCHRHDNCSSCHSAREVGSGPKLLVPGRTWRASHETCVRCHEQDRCQSCHYRDGQDPPAKGSLVKLKTPATAPATAPVVIEVRSEGETTVKRVRRGT
jgi:hypothetical protein